MLHFHVYNLSLFLNQYWQELVALLLLFAKLCNVLLIFFFYVIALFIKTFIVWVFFHSGNSIIAIVCTSMTL